MHEAFLTSVVLCCSNFCRTVMKQLNPSLDQVQIRSKAVESSDLRQQSLLILCTTLTEFTLQTVKLVENILGNSSARKLTSNIIFTEVGILHNFTIVTVQNVAQHLPISMPIKILKISIFVEQLEGLKNFHFLNYIKLVMDIL